MLRMDRTLRLGFLLMGLGFTVTQGLLVRELLVVFFGNELSIGLILGSWLVLEAVGSGLLGRLVSRWKGQTTSFATLQVLFALFLPLCLYLVYSCRDILGATPGEGISLASVFLSPFLILAPLALVDGAMFAFGCRAYSHLTGDEVASLGLVYVLEAVGAVAGGIIFTYVCIPFLYSLQTVLVLSCLNLASAALLLGSAGSVTAKRLPTIPGLIAVLVLLACFLGLLLSPLTEEVQGWATRRQWAGHNLVYSENSVYGNIAVVQREEQYTFYADGIPILSAPVPDVVLVEEMVHLPLLFIDEPRHALVLGGGVGGVIHELGKYTWQRIDYAELDPVLIKAVRRFPTLLTSMELSHPRVKVEHVDSRLLVRMMTWGVAPRPEEGYDLVIVNLPYPSTLQLNRLYTVEFYQMVQEIMAEEGILVIGCPGTLTYMSAELRDLNSVVYHTLQQAFPYVRPIPGDVTLWLASSAGELSTTPARILSERWEGRGLETQLLTASYVNLVLGQQRLDWFWKSLGVELHGGKEVVNRDLHPVGLLYGLSYWNARFAPYLARVFAFAGRLTLSHLSLLILGCGLILLAMVKLAPRGRDVVVPIAVATTGFAGMTADLINIFAFQILCGLVYHWVALFVTAFMAGVTLGGLLMTRRLAGITRARCTMLKLELALVLYWALVPVILIAFSSRLAHSAGFVALQGTLLFMNGLAGFLVGSQFPLANKMWLGGREGLRGALYACDLGGAFAGSVVVSVILVPVLGILKTCLLAAVLKLASLLLVTAMPPRS